MRSFYVFLGLITLCLSQSLYAKRFTNKYCEFELPAGWECALEGSEWVCQSENANRKKEAIIILAAKIRGEQDSLSDYQAYLKKTKTYTLPGGKTQVSEAKYTKVKSIHDQRWVDSLHLASEVPGFYTRYLATVIQDLGVAVTFSVAKDHYNSYQAVFDKIIESLRVFRQAKSDLGNFNLRKKEDDLLDSDMTFVPDSVEKFDIKNQKKGTGTIGGLGDDEMLLYLAILVVIVVVIIRKRKKK